MKQKELMQKINILFDNILSNNYNVLIEDDYFCDNGRKLVSKFIKNVKNLDERINFININTTGIGNNGRWKIVLEDFDDDGFIIEKTICYFMRIIGVFGGVYCALLDCNKQKIKEAGRAS